MATLFQRLAGNIPAGDTEKKLPIHGFTSGLNELRRGKLTQAEFATMFELSAGQQTAMLTLKDLIIAAPNKVEFLRVLKDVLYLAELNADSRYRTQSWVLGRLQDEVTDQGGTLP